jgi:hypothetical protein
MSAFAVLIITGNVGRVKRPQKEFEGFRQFTLVEDGENAALLGQAAEKETGEVISIDEFTLHASVIFVSIVWCCR